MLKLNINFQMKDLTLIWFETELINYFKINISILDFSLDLI